MRAHPHPWTPVAGPLGLTAALPAAYFALLAGAVGTYLVIVELGANGQVASVRVPTERRGSWTVPSDVSASERESIVNARFAMNSGEKGQVAAGKTPR